jgi:hypothetical protein
VALGGLSVFGLLRSEAIDYATEPRVQMDAGLWLRGRYPQDSRLMTITPSIAYYFYDAEHQQNQLDLPFAEYDALMVFAHRESADLVAAPEWQLEAARFPTARRLRPEGDHPGLAYVDSVGEPPFRVHVFRLEPQDEAPAGGAENERD